MKRILIPAIGALFALSGNAYAEGCNYGKHNVAMAAADEALESSPIEAQDPKLLALLEAEEAAKLEKTLPVVHN